MSGFTEDVIASSHVRDESDHFIQKPFSMNDLGAKIRKALGHSGPVA
jgi:DNA-binding response OmpR family regulator